MGMMSMLLGGAEANPITIGDQTVQDITGGGTSANAEYRLGADGVIYTRTGTGSYTPISNWCTPTSLASGFEVYATPTTGTPSTGTTGSWLALTAPQTWAASASIGSSKFCILTIDIRRTGSSTVLDSATITLEADAQL